MGIYLWVYIRGYISCVTQRVLLTMLLESKQTQGSYSQNGNSHTAKIRTQSKKRAVKRNRSTSDCILTLLFILIRLLFDCLCARKKKTVESLVLIFCYPVVYVIRCVNTIKWKRILNWNRTKKCLKRMTTGIAVRTLTLAKLNGRRYWLGSYYYEKRWRTIKNDVRYI